MKECCSINKKEKQTISDICPQCEEKGRKVPQITPFQMVKRDLQKYLKPETQYFFCESKDCPVVYFSEVSDNFLFKKEHIRIRVGQKEANSPIQVCYCFDYTEEDILEEVRKTGTSEAPEDITQKVKAGLCACEVRNPQGRCCLGNVTAAIKKAQKTT